MKIDRALFLVLTGSITAAACGGNEPLPMHPDNPSTDVTLVGLDASAPIAPIAPSEPPDAGMAAPPPDAAPPTPPAPPKPTAIGNDEDACGINPAKKFDPNRHNCNDNAAAAFNCKSLTAPQKEGCDSQYVQRECDGKLTGKLKPKVAAAAWVCMVRKNGPKLCEQCAEEKCVWEAMMGACPDPTADADCAAIANTCTGVDKVKCSSYLSGLTPGARAKAVECVKKDCSSGFYECATNVSL